MKKTDNPLLNKPINLETCNVAHLDVYGNPYNLRRDIHEFVNYVSQREVKRAHRSNRLPKADAKRIAKLMSHPDCVQDVQNEGYSWWIGEVDYLALRLDFVKYDTEGIYAGYSSHSPSYPDNYIEFYADNYDHFLQKPLVEQEVDLLNIMLNDKNYNEFYNRHIQSRLNGFSTWGSALGAMPHLNFPKARRLLLRLISNLESGVWYSTKSLISYLKKNMPYFLIPKASDLPKEKARWGAPAEPMKRYGNFKEFKQGREYYTDRNTDSVPDTAPDGFERVEGRFIERFLEGIPLTLGYVDVAYRKQKYTSLMPEMDMVQAFRVNGRFHQFMHQDDLTSKVTILPNYEIHVESPFYDPSLMHKLEAFAQLLTEDKVSVLKLDKQRVKAALAADTSIKPIPFLQNLTGQPLPQNIAIELKEWAEQADAFTLFEGFAVLEGDKRLPETKRYTVEQITPHIRLIRQPERAFAALKEAERIPLTIKHGDKKFAKLPAKARTIFPKTTKAKPKRKTKKRITLQRETKLMLTAPTAVIYEQLRDELLKQRALFEPNPAAFTITYAQSQKPQVDAALKALRQQYTIKFEDK